MFIRTAYARRDSLSDRDLERLYAALKDGVERYQYTIRNYPPERMEKYGKPFLAELEERVAEVRCLIAERAQRMADDATPYHGHIYYSAEQRPAAAALRDQFIRQTDVGNEPPILFVGRMMDSGVGPHPMAQYEIHFLKRSLDDVVSKIEASGLRALVHPLTDDDLADHTTLGHWIGEPLDLDLTVLDPPGQNQGVPRFGKTNF